ncbi:hypothetical protein BVC80_1803g13 [Macleaya cordata]|uniref:Stress induced protein n=1 Tax=Macleaya cordata TaxID=56857 RepID=A0A200QQZ9_MACCD|nr:hypothetical protein BVC80_1803g13 [Macleaya cordata]
METPHKKPTLFNNNSPFSQHEEEEEDDERELGDGGDYVDDDDYEETFAAGDCCCFRLFCFKSRRRSNNDYSARRILLQQQGEEYNRESWFVKRGKKLREISELMAGPKWKTFIRKMGTYCNNGRNNRRRMDTKYDPQSYALNFDDGILDKEEDVGAHLAGFSSSSRFSPAPS